MNANPDNPPAQAGDPNLDEGGAIGTGGDAVRKGGSEPPAGMKGGPNNERGGATGSGGVQRGNVPEGRVEKPSLCRMVLYRFSGRDQSVAAAVITGVHDDGKTVDLFVFPRAQPGVDKASIPQDLSHGKDQQPGTWRWPPRL